MLGYRIDLYFCYYEVVVEIDDEGNCDRNIDHDIKRQKAAEQKCGCEFIRIDPDKENFDVFKAIN